MINSMRGVDPRADMYWIVNVLSAGYGFDAKLPAPSAKSAGDSVITHQLCQLFAGQKAELNAVDMREPGTIAAHVLILSGEARCALREVRK
ncbi:hypothetical protein SAMN05421853_11441 [Roseivivax halotolerans]|uniref:Uncharacterized protein n=1 Tax=Roseivivax halotolerans TaxID=93684 RepID=A0A1I6A1X5_9RHOB|nr:hypothetical protein SAMN05421853_11441 [Roseivivax halotolerans]